MFERLAPVRELLLKSMQKMPRYGVCPSTCGPSFLTIFKERVTHDAVSKVQAVADPCQDHGDLGDQHIVRGGGDRFLLRSAHRTEIDGGEEGFPQERGRHRLR